LSEREFVQEALAQITWHHNLTLLEKCSDQATHIWYAQKTEKNGWSRNVLVLQIESNLHQRRPCGYRKGLRWNWLKERKTNEDGNRMPAG
jgi:predicted nuclease of restriction endonuclease-like (RecB) superfamily